MLISISGFLFFIFFTPFTFSVLPEAGKHWDHGDSQSGFLWWGRWAAVRGRVATLKLIMSRLFELLVEKWNLSCPASYMSATFGHCWRPAAAAAQKRSTDIEAGSWVQYVCLRDHALVSTACCFDATHCSRAPGSDSRVVATSLPSSPLLSLYPSIPPSCWLC